MARTSKPKPPTAAPRARARNTTKTKSTNIRNTKKAAPADPPAGIARRKPASFPIVGIGASAGGLEALEVFLQKMPPDPGMAFVVVQHLDPNRKGIMVALLQRNTLMPV